MCSKTRYGSKNIAETELKKFQKEGVLPKDLIIYNCEKCLGWHFTHKNYMYENVFYK